MGVIEGARAEHTCIDHFREWLRVGMTGCTFVSTFAARASEKRIAYFALAGMSSATELNGLVSSTGHADQFIVLLFPHLRSPGDVGELLETLDADPRWRCSRIPWAKHERTSDSLIAVDWQTESGAWSSVMGFAPLGEMPSTRRAPYVALAMWPGATMNDYRKGTPGPNVGLVDGVHGMTREVHDNAWATTEAKVKRLMADPPEDRRQLRQVAFCIPRTVAQALTFKDASMGPVSAA
jgi:hypothetical protein